MLMADAERKIQQLYNDVNAIYGMLDEIKDRQGKQGEQLDSLRRSLTSVAATQMRHGNRLEELDAGIAGLGDQLKEMRITQMRHENRFTEIDQRFDEQGEQLKGQDRKLDLIMKALDISAN